MNAEQRATALGCGAWAVVLLGLALWVTAAAVGWVTP